MTTVRTDQTSNSLPLTRAELTEGQRYGLYVLAEDLMAHHHEKGGQVIPQGRLVYVPGEKADVPENVVYRAHFLVAVSAREGKRTRKPVQIRPQGGRLLVVPQGKEQEWLEIARTMTGGRPARR